MSEIERVWLTHMGSFNPSFPREVAWPVGTDMMGRAKVENASEYIELIKQRVDRGDIWICTQSVPQYNKGYWDKVFIDIDDTDLRRAHDSMRRAVEDIKSRYGKYPRVTFTANKGFAIYIDIPSTKLDGMQIKLWCNRFARRLNIKSDEKVNGDKRRLCRLPYSWNTKSLKNELMMCVPIDPCWDFDRVLLESTNPTGAPYEIDPFQEVALELTMEIIPEPKPVNNILVGSMDLQPLVEIAKIIKDGRYRILFNTVLPACHANRLGLPETLVVAAQFVEASGASFHVYERRIENAYKWMQGRGIVPKSLEWYVNKDPEILGEIINGGNVQSS